MERYLKIYREKRRILKAYEYFNWIVNWDQETEAPDRSLPYRTKQVETMTEEQYRHMADPDYVEAIERLYERRDELDVDLSAEIRKEYKDLRIIKRVPKDEYIAYRVLTSSAPKVWAEAKEKDDFSLFEPTLERIVTFNRKLVKYLETDELKGYDILLDFYEEGFSTELYDTFFEHLRTELVPFVRAVTDEHRKHRFSRKLKGVFPVEKQREFAEYLKEVLHFSGVLKESVHPFTSGVSSTDTRITTHYDETNFTSSIFSTIHEIGHALYETQNDPKYDDTFLHGGASLGMHESQSRFYENVIGRSRAFWDTHYARLAQTFPKQLKNIGLDEFYRFINHTKRSLIRIEADELTYALHVMVRYELEKSLIDGRMKVADLPKKWRTLMTRYVGKRPKTDREGVLQDVHWSSGSFGYFPTYALGSAYAAQIRFAMAKELDIDQAIRENRIKDINDWLKERIHRYAAARTPRELMRLSTGADFDPRYYVDYLRDKFALTQD
ncbi:MAG: carboxypeptidase M32 [Acholeplasmataceae bacterium]